MALDDFTRRERRKYLGSSDMAAICGLDPYRTAGDVWAEKTGRLGDRDLSNNPAVEVGEAIEPAILDWAEKKIAVPLERAAFFTREHLCANVDGWGPSVPTLVEAKAMGILGHPGYLAAFGDAGSDAVPEHVLIQTHHQIAVLAEGAGLVELAYVAALLGGRGLVLFQIPRNPDLVDAILERGEAFWVQHVERDTPPPEAPSLPILKAMRRDATLAPVLLPRHLLVEWLATKERRKDAEALEEAAETVILHALGDAMEGYVADDPTLGQIKVLRFERRAYEVRAQTITQVRHVKARKER